jgi:hypothetical protein
MRWTRWWTTSGDGPVASAEPRRVGLTARIVAVVALGVVLLGLVPAVGEARPWAWLGVRIRDMSEQEMESVSARHGVREGFGVVIVEVLEDTPAGRAGMRNGDIVVALNDGQSRLRRYPAPHAPQASIKTCAVVLPGRARRSWPASAPCHSRQQRPWRSVRLRRAGVDQGGRGRPLGRRATVRRSSTRHRRARRAEVGDTIDRSRYRSWPGRGARALVPRPGSAPAPGRRPELRLTLTCQRRARLVPVNGHGGSGPHRPHVIVLGSARRTAPPRRFSATAPSSAARRRSGSRGSRTTPAIPGWPSTRSCATSASLPTRWTWWRWRAPGPPRGSG